MKAKSQSSKKRGQPVAGEMKIAGQFRAGAILHAKRPAHSQMGNNDIAVIHCEQKEFGAPAERNDTAARKLLGEAIGKRKPQIGPSQRNIRDHRPFHDGLKAAPDSLDFGQFGQRSDPPGKLPSSFCKIAPGRRLRYGPPA